MKRIIFAICISVLSSVTGGCEKEIEFKGEILEPRLTLSSRAVSGEPLQVFVSSSMFFLEDQDRGAGFKKNLDTSRGKLRCYVNSDGRALEMTLVEHPDVYSYCYACNYTAAPGDHIRIEADFPGFDPVRAETTVPRFPVLELLSAERRKVATDWGGEMYDIDLTLALSDDASYDKYYYIQPYIKEEGLYYGGGLVPYGFSSGDVIFRDGSGTAGQSIDASVSSTVTWNYFSDALIKGERYVFRITVNNVNEYSSGSPIVLKLAAVDEALYWFDYSCDRALSFFGDIFSEAATLYSNVEGGYGIFCSAAPVSLEVEW